MNTELELEPGGAAEVTQPETPDWVTEMRERQELIDNKLNQLLETPKTVADPNATYIPGTDIIVPSGWDDWTFDQQQAYTNTKQREQILAQVNSQMAPIATSHLMSQVKAGLSEDEGLAAEQILREAMKVNPNFVFDESNAHALRLMAIGAAEETRRAAGVKDGLASTPTAETRLTDMRTEAISKWGEQVGSAFTDDELKEIFKNG